MPRLPDPVLFIGLSLLLPICVGGFIRMAADSWSTGITWGVGAWLVQAVLLGALAVAVRIAMKRQGDAAAPEPAVAADEA